jgi:ribosomal protein S18 acetylase RimI-like enzyme
MIVAVEDDKVVGTVFIIYDPWDSFVYHLGVHPNYQRRGIGSALMEEAEKRLKEEV